MADTSPIPVRLEKSVIDRLDIAAARMGMNRAGIIKICLASFLDHFEKHGRAALPLNWEDVMASLDGRRLEARNPAAMVNRSEPTGRTHFVGGPVNTGATIEGVPPDVAETARKLAPVAQRLAREKMERERLKREPSRKAASTSENTSRPKPGTGQRNK